MRNSTRTVQAVIQADLVYARVGGTSLWLDLHTPSEAPSGLPTLLYLHGGSTSMAAPGRWATSPTPSPSASCRSSRTGSLSRA